MVVEVKKFGAEWCTPCKVLDKNLEGKEYTKINVDTNIEEAKKYNIRNVPCTLFFVNGEIKERKIGIFSAEDFDKIIKTISNDNE